MTRSVATAALVVLFGAGVAGAEIPASGLASFDALDEDHSGTLDAEEGRAIEAVGETFDGTDANRDGGLDKIEFEGAISGTTGTEVGAERASEAALDEEEEAE